MPIVTYTCEVCGEDYCDESDAEECEQAHDEEEEVKPRRAGDIIRTITIESGLDVFVELRELANARIMRNMTAFSFLPCPTCKEFALKDLGNKAGRVVYCTTCRGIIPEADIVAEVAGLAEELRNEIADAIETRIKEYWQ